MRTTFFSAKSYEIASLEMKCRESGHEPIFIEARLDETTALCADGSQAVCLFVNDIASAPVLKMLAKMSVQGIALRCAGFNQIDVQVAKQLGLRIARVPSYSPHAIAEYTVGLILMLNRKLHRAYNRVREGNFSLVDLLGYNLEGKTVAIIGTGGIGTVTAQILLGFGCKILACDPIVNPVLIQAGVRYVSLSEALNAAQIVSLHLPLNPTTHHIMNQSAIEQLQHGAMLINTSRGSVIDTVAVIGALKNGRIGSLGLDVYEREGPLFFTDRSNDVIDDDVFSRLQTFPNVVITGHQAYFTRESLEEIAHKTIENLNAFEGGHATANDL